jgi:hypothetical protein
MRLALFVLVALDYFLACLVAETAQRLKARRHH